MEIIALQQYTDKYVSLYEGEIRNIQDSLANRLIEKGIIAEHTEENHTGLTGTIETIDIIPSASFSTIEGMGSIGTGGVFPDNKTFKEIIGDRIVLGFFFFGISSSGASEAAKLHLYQEDFQVGGSKALFNQNSSLVQNSKSYSFTLYCKGNNTLSSATVNYKITALCLS